MEAAIQSYALLFGGDRLAGELCVSGKKFELRSRLRELGIQDRADISSCPTVGGLDCPGPGCPLTFAPMRPRM